MYCYLFVTQNDTVLKFGITKEHKPMKRVSIYSGLNKPSQVLIVARTNDEDFETKFKGAIDGHMRFNRDKTLGVEWIVIPNRPGNNYTIDYRELVEMFYAILINNV